MNTEKCPKCNVVRVPGDRSPERLEIIERLNDEKAGWFVGAVFECGSYIVPQSGRVSESAQCLRNQLAQAQAEIKDNELRMEEAADQVQSQARTICDLRAEIESKDEALIKANNAYLLLNREMNRYRDNCREMQRGKEQAQAEIERLQSVVEAAAEYLSQYEGVYDMAVPTSHQSEQAKAAERRLRAALSAAPSKGEVLAVVDSTVYMQDNAAWLSIIKLPPMPDQPVTVTVRRREEER
jgi:septal ring factor EnvC (AmiA/AmiB activator)